MQWEHMKQQLMDFYAENGHINVPNELAYYKLRIWLNQQRYYYKRRKDGLSSPMTPERIKMLETAIPDFSWRVRGNNGPSLQDWGKLFDAMRAKGLKPGMRPKTHWFEGTNPFAANIKDVWTEQDLLALWNQADSDGDDEDTDLDVLDSSSEK